MKNTLALKRKKRNSQQLTKNVGLGYVSPVAPAPLIHTTTGTWRIKR